MSVVREKKNARQKSHAKREKKQQQSNKNKAQRNELNLFNVCRQRQKINAFFPVHGSQRHGRMPQQRKMYDVSDNKYVHKNRLDASPFKCKRAA